MMSYFIFFLSPLLLLYNLLFYSNNSEKNKNDILLIPFASILLTIYSGIKKAKFYLEQRKKITKEKNYFLVEFLNLICTLRAALKAGLSVPQAIHYSFKNTNYKTSCRTILESLVHQNTLNKSMHAVLTEFNTDFITCNKNKRYVHLLLQTLLMSLKQGGNTYQPLTDFEIQIRNLFNLKNKAKTYMAQMNMQATILLISPFVLTILMYSINPLSIQFFFSTFIGNVLLLIMFLLNTAGYILFKKTLFIKGL